MHPLQCCPRAPARYQCTKHIPMHNLEFAPLQCGSSVRLLVPFCFGFPNQLLHTMAGSSMTKSITSWSISGCPASNCSVPSWRKTRSCVSYLGPDRYEQATSRMHTWSEPQLAIEVYDCFIDILRDAVPIARQSCR